eukprot:GHVS01052968.1.p1 GENE.GHVS01052968.1~~GHVS01052968.1.p1  ORF type:complete len:650 (+),score=87.24 GHVS01052968.1:1625-3574(+)
MVSLKQICKQRLLDEMLSSSTAGGTKYVVLVVDDATLRILSAACKVYDILQQGVTVVELLSRRRQRLPDLDVVYFLSPNHSSVDLLVNDFTEKPQYRNVYIFFSAAVGVESGLMDTIADCTNLMTRIKCFKELNLDFIAYEHSVFHLDNPHHLSKLFPLSRPELLHDIADKLLCVCASLNEKPMVRYQSNRFGCCQQLAATLQAKLGKSGLAAPVGGSSTLLILDRSVDTATLFAHEYTYQACAYDLLAIPVCGSCTATTDMNAKQSKHADLVQSTNDTFDYTITNNMGKEEPRKAVLGESDELWVRFRHQHIDWVTRTVNEEVQKFINENAAAKLQRTGTLSSDEAMQAIRGLPEYQEMLAKYWSHVAMTSKCHDELKQNRLLEGLGTLEQDICCGVDMDGGDLTASRVLSSLGWMLAEPHIEMQAKLRLVLLYFTQTVGIGELERRKIMEAAQLSLDSQRSILAFLRMELHVSDEAPPSNKPKHRLELLDKEKLKCNKKRAKVVDKELSRFEPYVKDIMLKAAHGSLHGGQYPYVEDPTARRMKPFADADQQSRGVGIGRSAKWDWGSTNETATSTAAGESSQASAGGGSAARLIVFVLGGITLAETRCAYEVARETKTDIFIGGSCVLTPNYLLQMLKDQTSTSQF